MFCSLLLLGSSEQNMTSLGIPFSDWMNENVSQLVAEHVSSVNGSIEQHGEYKFSNKFSNLLSNVWLVWKHYKRFRRSCSSMKQTVHQVLLTCLATLLLRRREAGARSTSCDEYVCLFVCLSVCSNNSKTTRPNFTKSPNVLCMLPISFQDFQPMWSWSTNVTDRRTDRQTDDMPSQDHTLHYSASRGKNWKSAYDRTDLCLGSLFSKLTPIVGLLPCDHEFYWGKPVGFGTRNPKVIWEEPRRHPSRQGMDSPATCAMSLQTSPITQPPVRYIHTDARNFAQLRHKVPIGYNWMRHAYARNCPFPFNDLYHHLTHLSLDRPHSPP